MPTSADSPAAVDTSVAVAALDATHAAHDVCLQAVRTRRPALAGHAAFELHAVLTRLPGRLAVAPDVAAYLVARVFPEVVALDHDQTSELHARVGPLGIVGGAVYDALVAESALVHDRVLLTRDRRARRTYDLLGVHHEQVGP